MPLFPKIQSPCPYVDRLAEVVDGDMCRMCRRQVFDLTAMSDGDRLAFLAGCEEEVCVSYSIPIGPALRAAAVAAAIALPSAAAAVPQGQPQQQAERVRPPSTVVAGGIAAPPTAQIVAMPERPSLDDVRSLYEKEQKPEAEPARAGKPPRR